MVGRFIRELALGSALAAIALPAAAQNWGSVPREGACFYEHANYEGKFFCVESGNDFDRLPSGANDQVSSIRVYGNVEVTVYERTDFRGDSKQFRRNVENLADDNFNDRISSVRVRRSGSYGGSNNRSGSSNPDRIVKRAYQDILQRDPDPEGLRLYRSRIIDDGWTEQQVREALRNSPEYRDRNTMTYQKAQDIVRRAYLNILKREPDPASAGYVQRVLRDKWTQADVERELRKSPEYKGRD